MSNIVNEKHEALSRYITDTKQLVQFLELHAEEVAKILADHAALDDRAKEDEYETILYGMTLAEWESTAREKIESIPPKYIQGDVYLRCDFESLEAVGAVSLPHVKAHYCKTLYDQNGDIYSFKDQLMQYNISHIDTRQIRDMQDYLSNLDQIGDELICAILSYDTCWSDVEMLLTKIDSINSTLNHEDYVDYISEHIEFELGNKLARIGKREKLPKILYDFLVTNNIINAFIFEGGFVIEDKKDIVFLLEEDDLVRASTTNNAVYKKYMLAKKLEQ